MATYGQDEVIAAADDPPGVTPFVGIILSGLATTTVAPCHTLCAQALPAAADAAAADPARPAAFLTHGSVFGLLGALTGTGMPGRGCVVAHSEMRATHVFEISKPVIDKVCALTGCVLSTRCADGVPTRARGCLTVHAVLWPACVVPCECVHEDSTGATYGKPAARIRGTTSQVRCCR